MLSEGMTPWDMINIVLLGFEPKKLSEEDIEYKCYCSRERVEAALISIGKDELTKMQEEGKDISVTCQFCDKVYTFTPRHIDSVLLDMGKSLRNGEISADPYFKNSLDNACLYCDYYEACHFGDDKADHVRYISKLRPGQVWDKMRQKEESDGR